MNDDNDMNLYDDGETDLGIDYDEYRDYERNVQARYNAYLEPVGEWED